VAEQEAKFPSKVYVYWNYMCYITLYFKFLFPALTLWCQMLNVCNMQCDAERSKSYIIMAAVMQSTAGHSRHLIPLQKCEIITV
jgi:hypothetical protein